MFKTSIYNFIIPIKENQVFLLYNSLNNGLYEATWKEGELLKKLEKMKTISENEIDSFHLDLKKLLIEGGFILDMNVDEIELIKKRKAFIQESIYNSGEFILTIAPTNSCNMACSYCYEGEAKPINGGMSELIMNQIIDFLEKEIKNRKLVKEFKRLSVQWYGGEPMLRFDIIEKLSKRLMSFSEKHKIEYNSDLITNGTLLDSSIWPLLLKYKIKNVQITIDGYKITHNASRPLKGKNKESYFTIMKNLSEKPQDIHINVRINADKNVVQYLDKFLKDLEKYKIWPYNSKSIQLQLARKEYYNYTNFKETELLYSQEDFYNEYDKFQLLKFNFYNNWIIKHPERKKAKRSFYYPKPTTYICKVAHFPYGITIDQDGNIFKCWEYINHSRKIIQHISEDYNNIVDNLLYKEMVEFDKITECSGCKYLPLCEVNCVARCIDPNREKQHCEWKFLLEKRFVYQYCLSVDQPDKIHAFKKIEDVRRGKYELEKIEKETKKNIS